MIVKMLHLDLLCVAAESDSTLEALRSLGAVHLDLSSAQGADVSSAKGEAADAEKAVRFILKARGKGAAGAVKRTAGEVLAIQKSLDCKNDELEDLNREIAKYENYGDFDPALARKLLDRGIDLAGVVELPEVLPPKRLGEMKADALALKASIDSDAARLAESDEKAIVASFPELSERIAFAAAKEIMLESGAISAVAGWIPERNLGDLKTAAAREGWGLLTREAMDGETPPTLV